MSVPTQKEGDSSTPKRDADGHPIHNEILLRLPRKEFERLLSHLEFVRLTLRLVLHEAGETLKSGYFCNSGLFSVVSVMPDGKSVEVGLVGKEGFSAVPLVAGFRTANTRTVVQGEGTAFRVDAGVLRNVLRESPVLERELQRYAQLLALQAVQIAACNRLHEVDERLARWLLMTEDRLSSSSLPLTQDFIAQMLGTRRSSVTVSAGTLQKAGLISYTRGSVTILNRRRLEQAACDCYGLLRQQAKKWLSEDD
ncbi:MAG: Crp/Fnr family transcriptional regulator [Candidatus Sulfotelmatobacter sp.]